MLVTEAIWWREEVRRFQPDRLDEFDALPMNALAEPTKPTERSG